MKKACFAVLPFYQNNRVFDLTSEIYNRDNCAVPFAMLRDKFAQRGYDLSTQDINGVNESECVIYLDMPKTLPETTSVAKSFLLIYETDVIAPKNWDMNKHKLFRKIFTWNDSMIDRQKYFKMNWSYVLPQEIEYLPENKTKFCCLIAGNKSSRHELELYSARVEAIRWFEKHHSELFDLFGIGWNEIQLPGNRFFESYKLLKLVKNFLSLFADKYPSYRGKIKHKLQTLRQYKFSICYENARDIPGYITEKIFDCLFAGCIPVYWGCNNITEHIPADCFIDKRKFSSYQQLFEYMSGMTDEAYAKYINSTQNFLRNAAARQFSAEYFAEIVTNEVFATLA
ncbi:MAG: hypothetical protein KKB51_13080 [Candidatus Riflebacteria bacterium]|nr:hypothetical protein [Candidatus Riflebacteria bacterium]